ncbi:hypothetical protein IC575_020294 [Cucumis melo]
MHSHRLSSLGIEVTCRSVWYFIPSSISHCLSTENHPPLLAVGFVRCACC